jgi:hypothetical protein
MYVSLFSGVVDPPPPPGGGVNLSGSEGNALKPFQSEAQLARWTQCSWKSPLRIWRTRSPGKGSSDSSGGVIMNGAMEEKDESHEDQEEGRKR